MARRDCAPDCDHVLFGEDSGGGGVLKQEMSSGDWHLVVEHCSVTNYGRVPEDDNPLHPT